MLTSTIPRLVRGRIYHIKHAFYNNSYEYLGIFKGLAKHHNYTDYAFLIIAEECHDHLIAGYYSEYIMEVAKKGRSITEVSQEDLFIYAGYEFKSDLYKELLADPSINLKVKLKLKSRVSKALRGKGNRGRNQSK